MKLIDENGKFFGKVNIVDLIVLVLIIAIAAAAIVRVSSKKLNAPVEEGKEGDEYCYVTILASLVVPEVADGLKVGDKLVANNAYTDAEIVSVDSAPAAYVGTNSAGEAVYSEHPMWKDVTVVIKEKVDPASVILKVGNQEARVGYSYIVKTQTVEANGRIRGIEFKSE